MSDWKDIIGTVAPTIATALGGPLAGLAIGVLGDVLGLDEKTQEKVAARMAGATPDDLVRLKTAELNFKQRMAELQIDLERIATEDRNSARNREVQVKDRTPTMLATLIVGGYCYVQWFLLQNVIDVNMRDIVMRMLGVLDGALMMVLAYYFGSSASSRAKDSTIAKLSE